MLDLYHNKKHMTHRLLLTNTSLRSIMAEVKMYKSQGYKLVNEVECIDRVYTAAMIKY
jgi:hypothetical protein